MTEIADVRAGTALPSFGVFARIGEVFSLIFRRRPGLFIGLGLLLPVALPIGLFLGAAAMMDVVDPNATLVGTGVETGFFTGAALAFVLSWMFLAGILTIAGCDAMADERRSLGFYFGQTVRRLHVMLILGALAMLAVLAGSALFVIVGLWAASVYSVFLPALLWDGAGWNALGRSRRLTKEYRWPIVGLILLFYLGFIALYILLGFAATAGSLEGETGEIVVGILIVTLQALCVPILCALPPVIHARLRAIKEGDSSATLRAVFE